MRARYKRLRGALDQRTEEHTGVKNERAHWRAHWGDACGRALPDSQNP